MFESEKDALLSQISTICQEKDIPQPEDLLWSHIPFEGEWGISTSFFSLAAKEARQKPGIDVPARAAEIAATVADSLELPQGFHRVEGTKGYLNLYFDTALYSQRVVDSVLKQAADYGKGSPTNKRIMVEFSQPNTHKALHVGHLRNMILGDAICRILKFAGYDVVRANYPGDTGLHVIKWLWNYQKFHAGEKPGEDKIRWMGDLYAEANERIESNPDDEREMRKLFKRWEEQDPEIIALWQQTRQWSIEGFEDIYSKLGIRFDRYYFQSDEEESGKALVDELIDREIAIDERPDGPVIIRIDDILGLEKEEYRVLVILRSDSTALYATWDLPLAIRKFNDFKLERSIYVIDVRQALYLKQIYKTLEIIGYEWAQKCFHLAYELVNLPGNVTMKSREGTVVFLEDLLREAVKRALGIVMEKNPELPEEIQLEIAEAVGYGAIKYPMLARENTKLVTFDWESALDINGQAAPYIQYAHVRANSILRRFDSGRPSSAIPKHELQSAEVKLIDLIARFPDEVMRAAQDYKTLHITSFAYETARAFNEFYKECPVLKAEDAVRDFRLRLVESAKIALANALSILGIEAPSIM